MPSAQDARSKQAVAMAAALCRWGSAEAGCTPVIAHPVCKGKFRPWKAGTRQFGCFRHHEIRRQRIAKAGLREGWEPFDQWPRPPDIPSGLHDDEAGTEACNFIEHLKDDLRDPNTQGPRGERQVPSHSTQQALRRPSAVRRPIAETSGQL